MVRIAAYQGPSVEDFNANMARVMEAIDRAGSQGADFLCFPETYLSNYGPGLAVHADDKRVHEMVRRSERFDMVVIVGLSEKEAGRVLNTMLVIYQGRVLGKYRKTMLTGYDRTVFAPDYDLPVFEAKGIRFGVIVCHDSSFVEPALAMRWKGARLLFSPHFNRIPEDTADEHRILVRNNHVGLAVLLQTVVVRANIVGGEPGKIGYGDSAIFSPLGVAVAQAPLFKEALIHADFDESVFREERWRTRAEIPMSVRDQLSDAMRAFGGGAGR